MRRIVGALVILLMAAVTGRAVQSEVVVHVAGAAGRVDVSAGKGKAGGVVIEGRARPTRRVVTLRAVLRESGSSVRRIIGTGPVGLMATETGRARQVEIIV